MDIRDIILFAIAAFIIFDDTPSPLEIKERALTVCLQEGNALQGCQKIVDDAFSHF